MVLRRPDVPLPLLLPLLLPCSTQVWTFPVELTEWHDLIRELDLALQQHVMDTEAEREAARPDLEKEAEVFKASISHLLPYEQNKRMQVSAPPASSPPSSILRPLSSVL